jgi:YggT family protein
LSVVSFLYVAVTIYAWLIVVRALLSWFRLGSGTPLSRLQRLVYALTEPYLALFRRFLPIARFGSVGIDLSAMVGLVVLFILVRLVVRL